MKVCGPRASARIYSREELIVLVKSKFPDENVWRPLIKKSKQEMCERLGLPYHAVMENVSPVVDASKVCTARRSKAFPNRYTREELVRLAKTHHRTYSLSKLRGMRVKNLCALARLPFRVTPPTPTLPRHGRTISAVAPADAAATGVAHLESCRIRGMKQLQAHQNELLDKLDHVRGVLAIHSTGSGKTLTAVVASQCYLDEHPTHRVLVLTPSSLTKNFAKELDEFGPELRHRSRYTVVSYQYYVQKCKSISWYLSHHRPLPAELLPFRSCRNTMLIVDEAHNFRTPYKPKTGKRKAQGIMTKHLTECAEQANRVLLLSATPIVNSPKDILTLLNMIRDRDTPPITVFPTDPASQQTLLEHRLHFFRPTDDVHREIYPETRNHDVFLTMTPAYARKYKDVETSVATEDNIDLFGDINLRAFHNGLRRATNVLDSETSHEISPKIRWVLDFIQNHPNEKTVIFSQFLDMGSLAVFRRLPAEIRNKVAFVTGQTPVRQRQDIVRQFNENEKTILFLSKAGGEGLDLKGTRQIILVEPSWNQSAEQQVTGRGIRYRSHAHLPFQERVVDVYRLYLVKPQDAQNLERILREELLYYLAEEAAAPVTVHQKTRSRKTRTTTGGGEGEEEQEILMVSVDLMIRILQERKQKAIHEFLEMLRQLSS